MSDIIQMQLKAEISSASIKHMQAQIKELESKPLKINIDTSSASKSVKGLSATMEGMTKPANFTTLSFKELGMTVDKVTSEVTSLASGAQGVTKKITEATDVSGKMLKITESLNIETGKTQKTVESVTESYKGQRKAMEDIASFQRKMLGADGQLGQLDQFAIQKDGQFNPRFLEDITSRVKALNPEMANYGTNIKNINTDFGLLKGSTQELGSVLGRAAENMGKFLRFYLVGGAIVKVVNSVKDGVASIVELDTSLTELARVSDLTGSQLGVFTDRAYEAGKAIGRTGKEVIDGAAEFKRAGFEIEEALQLSQDALLFTNIGDGIENIEQASSALISILKGFNLEANDTMHVIDSLNEVSNNYALDAENLTEIMKRVSGTVAQTGTSFEELIGLSVGGFESLRSAEQVASGINMITQRLKGNDALYVQKCA